MCFGYQFFIGCVFCKHFLPVCSLSSQSHKSACFQTLGGGRAMRMDTPCLQGVLCVCGETRLCVPHSLGSRLMCADASRQRERVWAGGTFIWGGNTAAPIALAARVHLSIHPALRCTWYVPCVILDIRKLKTSETEFLPQKTHRPVWGVDTKNRSFRFGVGRVVQMEVAVERGGRQKGGGESGRRSHPLHGLQGPPRQHQGAAPVLLSLRHAGGNDVGRGGGEDHARVGTTPGGLPLPPSHCHSHHFLFVTFTWGFCPQTGTAARPAVATGAAALVAESVAGAPRGTTGSAISRAALRSARDRPGRGPGVPRARICSRSVCSARRDPRRTG